MYHFQSDMLAYQDISTGVPNFIGTDLAFLIKTKTSAQQTIPPPYRTYRDFSNSRRKMEACHNSTVGGTSELATLPNGILVKLRYCDSS